MNESNDVLIWDYAITQSMILISKGEDFYYLATSPHTLGKLIWVRIGKCRRQTLLDVFRVQLGNVVNAFETGSLIVEIR